MTIDFDKLKQKIAEDNKRREDYELLAIERSRAQRRQKLESGARLASELRQWLQKSFEDVEVSEVE